MHSRPLMRVLFVARGSVKDGLGHVMRSRTVAAEIGTKVSARFIVLGDEFVDALLVGRGLRHEIVREEEEVMARAAEFAPHVVVLDMLRFDRERLLRLKERAMVVSLSPVFDQLELVDILYHRSQVHDPRWKFGPTGPHLECGLQYTVVRANCRVIPEEIYRRNLADHPLSVAISMGGADAGNKTLEVLDALQAVPAPLLIWVLLGEGYAHSYNDLVERVKRDARHEVILAKTADSMWRVMQTCALALLMGGTITYEAVHARLPSLNVFDSASQLFLVQELLERGVCVAAGYPFREAVEVACANIAHLEKSRDELLEMHRRTQDLIDGRGAWRIGEGLREHYWNVFQAAHPERRPSA